MAKTVKTSDVATLARKRLLEMKSEVGSWRAVSRRVHGLNAGYLSRVAKGQRPPSNKLLIVLGLPPRAVAVEPLACGHAPLAKRCPVCRKKPSRKWRPAAVGVW